MANYLIRVCVFYILCTHVHGNYIMKIKNNILNSTFSVNEMSLNKSINEEYILPDIGMLESILHSILNTNCRDDFNTSLQALKHKELWAMQMFDASTKYPEGLLYGQTYQLGNFDECIEVNHNKGNESRIKGKYCLVDISQIQETRMTINSQKLRRRLKKEIHWATCVPHSCTPNDVEMYFHEVFKALFAEEVVTISVPQLNCYMKNALEFTNIEIIYAVVISIFVVFIILATIYHIAHIYKKTYCSNYCLDRRRKPNSTNHEVILAFSLVRNVSKVIEVKTKNNDFNLDCISGIRTISMLFILTGHSLIFILTAPIMNANFYDLVVTKAQNAIFLNNPLLVDTFLLISGFLMCRLLLLEMDKRNGKINFIVLYIARYIRLTPAYLVVLGFYCTFLLRINNGPLWKQRLTLEKDRCVESWWANLLYINNYVQTNNLCMFQSWYLSVDTQLFTLAPLIIYPLWKRRRIGEIILGIAIITTIITPFVITYVQKLDPTLMIYIPYKIKWSSRLLGWLIVSFLGLSSLFSVLIFYQEDRLYNELESALYSPLHRIAWCLAICWTIMICVTQEAGIINNFLSWKPFAVISKLTYCAYLVNGLVEIYSYGNIRAPRFLSVYNLFIESTAHIITTFLVAFILCILFESPIHSIEKILLRKERKQLKKSSDSTQEIIDA